MRIPGFLTDTLFYLRTLTTISVLSIGLQTYAVVRHTSEGSTFTNYENLEVEVGELKVKATGKNTTEALTNLIGSVVKVEILSREKSNISIVNLEDGSLIGRFPRDSIGTSLKIRSTIFSLVVYSDKTLGKTKSISNICGLTMPYAFALTFETYD